MWMLGSLMTSRWQSLSSATSSISPAPAQPAVTCPMAQRRYAFVGGGFDVVFLELLPEQPYYPQAGWSPSRFVFTLLPCLRNDKVSAATQATGHAARRRKFCDFRRFAYQKFAFDALTQADYAVFEFVY